MRLQKTIKISRANRWYKKHIKKRNWIIGIIGVLGLGVLNQAVYAQDANYAMMFMVDGKDHKETELYKAIKEHAEWRTKAGDPWSWDIWQIVIGENLGRYIIRSGNHTLADLDPYDDFLAKGHVEWMKNVMPYIESEWNFITMSDKEISHWPEGMGNMLILYFQEKAMPELSVKAAKM